MPSMSISMMNFDTAGRRRSVPPGGRRRVHLSRTVKRLMRWLLPQFGLLKFSVDDLPAHPNEAFDLNRGDFHPIR
jgi:hypothetical protein